MADFKDHFSHNAPGYFKARPGYPEALFEFLSGLCPHRNLAWDAATGNGQAAVGLSTYFDKIIATDASASQIAAAPARKNIVYRVELAEAPTTIAPESLDLICMAQAYHWVDPKQFLAVAEQLLKPAGILAIFCYGLIKIRPDIDLVISEFYHQTLADFWPEERRHIDTEYATLPFPYPLLKTPDFVMLKDWDCSACLQYLQTWSAVNRYKKQKNVNPLAALSKTLVPMYKDRLTVSWPIHLKVGIKQKL